MSLTDIQRAFAAICYAPEPASRDMQALGDAPARWQVYRNMVRTRLERMAKNGLPRTVRTLGDAAFSEAFAGYLAAAPPRTRYIRDIVPLFVDHAAPGWQADDRFPPHLVDLARFEAARWEVADAPDPAAPAPAELTFEHVPVLHPAHRLLRLDHPVHRKLPAGAAYPQEPCALLVYRRTGGDKAEVMSLNPVTADLVARWARQAEPVAESVRAVAQARGLTVDEPFLEGLCDVLAKLLERGVVLGGGPPERRE